MKVLRPTGFRPDWRGIEVRRHTAGWCELVFTEEAARLAESAGVQSVAVSLSHDGGMAAAVVVATCDEPKAS